jgi:hypothetical protein
LKSRHSLFQEVQPLTSIATMPGRVVGAGVTVNASSSWMNRIRNEGANGSDGVVAIELVPLPGQWQTH